MSPDKLESRQSSMLPGFNHNIRYKDRVFHVQTEDNGVQQPVLVTQVFIEGHIIAIERVSYEDLLQEKDSEKQEAAVRERMQGQHKRLLKALVHGDFDHKIQRYLGTSPPKPAANALAHAAESLPEATADLMSASLMVDPKHPEAIPPHSPPLGAPPIPGVAHSPPLGAESINDDDLFRVFDEELQKQVPWSPTTGDGMLPPLDPKLFPTPAVTLARAPSQPAINFKDQTASDRTTRPKSPVAGRQRKRLPPESPTEVNQPLGRGFTPPPVADTLVDFGLPASLKEQLGQAKAALEAAKKKGKSKATKRKSDPRVARFRMPPNDSTDVPVERETQIDMELRRRASSSRGQRQDPSAAATVEEMGASEIKKYIDRKKAEAEAKKQQPGPAKQKEPSWGDAVPDSATPPHGTIPTAKASPAEDARPSIVVVETSLDEVILSYLADDD